LVAHPTAAVEALAARLQEKIRHQESIEAELAELLPLVEAQAIGLWRVSGEQLTMVGFAAAASMAGAVRREFVEATRTVPLTQTNLGIVNAVVNRVPAVATVNVTDDGLEASAGWLGRFGARQSLSMPIATNGRIVGALAVSSAHAIEREGTLWTVISTVAARFGAALQEQD
jgi:GAF domain-containing protein